MGRKPSPWTNLPPGMCARERGNKTHYDLDTGGKPRKEVPLGPDYVKAVQRWAELTEERRVAGPKFTFMDLTHDYRAKVLPSKASRTQEDNTEELE